MKTVLWNVYDTTGEETTSFEVGSDECGDESTAERDACKEATRQTKRFGSKRLVERVDVVS